MYIFDQNSKTKYLLKFSNKSNAYLVFSFSSLCFFSSFTDFLLYVFFPPLQIRPTIFWISASCLRCYVSSNCFNAEEKKKTKFFLGTKIAVNCFLLEKQKIFRKSIFHKKNKTIVHPVFFLISLVSTFTKNHNTP